MASIASHSAANSPRLSGKASMTSSPRTRNNQHAADPSVPIIKQPEDTRDNVPPTTNAPLAPPPRPTQNSDGDYFGAQIHKSHLSKEPNPFENAFGNP
ncbi:Transcription factor, partial [Friedmanniomyces endolithicus]